LTCRKRDFDYISRVALRVFGLTGGIGSGKSTVAQHFRARGLPVVNADDLAREAVLPGTDALARIVDYFGTGIVSTRGELDRPQLGGIVFADTEARGVLDRIVHPAVRKLASEHFARIGEQGAALACYEVPLLYEVGLERTYAPVVVVNAPESLRQPRLAARDGLDERQLQARIASQMPLAEKARRADYVIENDGSFTQLNERTDTVFDAVCHALAIDPARYPKPELR
jgi:dephospho-CoA kinase